MESRQNQWHAKGRHYCENLRACSPIIDGGGGFKGKDIGSQFPHS